MHLDSLKPAIQFKGAAGRVEACSFFCTECYNLHAVLLVSPSTSWLPLEKLIPSPFSSICCSAEQQLSTQNTRAIRTMRDTLKWLGITCTALVAISISNLWRLLVRELGIYLSWKSNIFVYSLLFLPSVGLCLIHVFLHRSLLFL